jgi:hypothetical protein
MINNSEIENAGSIYAIPLRDRTYAYACVLDSPLLGFFNIKTREKIELTKFEPIDFLFKVFVNKYANKEGKWTLIGRIDLPPFLKKSERFFKKDPISKKFYIYYDEGQNGIEILSSREEVFGLESASVWNAEHIEERLFRNLSGQESMWEKLVNKI